MSLDLIARTVRGVEYVAADEISSALSPGRLVMQPREVVFSLDEPVPALVELRTVDDLFLAVGSGPDLGHRKDVVPQLAERAVGYDWRSAVDAVATVRELPGHRHFDVVASLLGRRNYSRYDVEDAVGTALAKPLGARYVSRRDSPAQLPPVDLSVRVFISADTTQFALRLAAGPLHRRRYKQDASRGTLHPPMAAAMARLLLPATGQHVLDPFCGDGTIPIETAAIAPDAEIAGSDNDPERIRNARANATRAQARVAFTVADAGRLDLARGSVDLLLTNPPWNVAVEASGSLSRGFDPFWDHLADAFSDSARACLIMDAELEAVKALEARGYRIALAQQVRLAGRLSQLVVCTPSGRPAWPLPQPLAEQRRHALAAGLTTETGFGSVGKGV